MQNLLTPKALAIAALVYYLPVEAFHVVASDDMVDSKYIIRDILFGLSLYGWLAIFIVLGIAFRAHTRLFFLIGTLPIGLFALLLTILSWPIFLPTPALMTLAIIKETERLKSH